MNSIQGKVPAKVRAAFRTKNRFTCCYEQESGHFIASKAIHDTRQDAIRAAAEQGMRPDVESMDDIRLGWAAWRFNGTGPSRYCEVDEGARGAFPVWIFPVIVPGE
jgi:hypothetical protein